VGKKKDDNKLAELVEELIADVGNDRNRLSDFLDNLITSGESPLLVAEYVAKIAAELTRQNQVKVATIKALGKSLTEDDGTAGNDELAKEIGLPFPEEETDEGSN
jgi:hypothetical protein